MGDGALPFTGSLRGPGIAPLLPQAPLPILPASPHFFPLGHPFCPVPREGMWQILAFPIPCALMYIVNKPLHWRPQKELEGWTWPRGAVAVQSTSGGYVSSAPDRLRAVTLCSWFLARGQIQNSSLFLFSKRRDKCPLAEGLAVWVGF